jgi:enoyl-CoA hydratase/carnithine racemase
VQERPYRLVRVVGAGATARITLNNPARKNAIGPVIVSEMLYALEDAHADDAVRVIVLTGEGDAFCAGGDFSQMVGGGPSPAEGLPGRGDFAELMQAMMGATKPIIARVNGAALGGGLGLVAASHFAVAQKGAKLGTPEINVGVFPMIIMAVLSRIVPRRQLLEMMLFGDKMDAGQALSLGLLNRVVDAAELDGAVDGLVEKLVSRSPAVLRLGLEAHAKQADLALEEALPYLRERLGAVLATDDAREGLMAFLEKRTPKWTGR